MLSHGKCGVFGNWQQGRTGQMPVSLFGSFKSWKFLAYVISESWTIWLLRGEIYLSLVQHVTDVMFENKNCLTSPGIGRWACGAGRDPAVARTKTPKESFSFFYFRKGKALFLLQLVDNIDEGGVSSKLVGSWLCWSF
jgi:hypothetical protein